MLKPNSIEAMTSSTTKSGATVYINEIATPKEFVHFFMEMACHKTNHI
jgi:hypothetical protein